MIFAQITDDGQIEQIVERTTAPHLSAHLLDITDQPLARQAANYPTRFYMKGRSLVAKPRVDLLPERLMFKANGTDIVKVKVQTEYNGTINLKIGSKEVAVEPNEELEISADSLGIITIMLNDPHVYGSGISIYAEAVHES